MRPKQWLKMFRLLHLFFKIFLRLDMWSHALLGFAAFCCVSSSGYILNDIMDIEADRAHPKKKNRPIASGALPKTAAYILFVLLISLGSFIAYVCSPWLLVITLCYLCTTLSYSFYFKHIVYLTSCLSQNLFFMEGCCRHWPLTSVLALTLICTVFLALFPVQQKKSKLLLVEDRPTRKPTRLLNLL